MDRAAIALAGEVELPKLRTLGGKTFLRPDGTVRVVHKPFPQHFPLNGQLVDIDDSPEVEADVWSVKRAPYVLRWDSKAVSLTYVSRKGGGVRVRLISLDGKAFDGAIAPAESRGQNVRVLVHPELEIELRLYPLGVEIFKRLLGPTAPRALRWEVIEDDVTNVAFDPLAILAHDNMDGLTDRPGDMLARRRAEVVITKGPVTQTPEGRSRYVVTETVTGRTRRVNPDTGARAWVSEVAYPLVIDVTVTETIATNNDDGSSNTTNFYTANYCYTTSSGSRLSVWRFQTVDVPQGQTLTSATFTCTVTANASSGAGTIKGNNVDDAAAWTPGGSGSPATMAATTAGASWSISGTGVKTLDVTSVVQEIINRAGWVANNNLRLGVTTPWSGGTVTFSDGSASLEIIYSSGATPITGSDTGAGTDATAIASSSTQGDTASGAEATTILVSLSGADTGSGAEATATTAIFGGADAGAGGEGTATQAGASGADAGAGAEGTAIGVTLAGADTGSGAEATATQAGLTAADTGAAAEGTSVDTGGGVTTKSDGDTATGSEATAIASSTTQGDTAAAGEATAIASSSTVGDTGTGAEARALLAGLAGADTGAAAEARALAVSAAAGDAGAGSEGASSAGSVSAADSGSAVDSGSVSDASAVQITAADLGSAIEAAYFANLFGRRAPDHPRIDAGYRPVATSVARPPARSTSRRPRQ